MTRRRALERWETKIANTNVTPQAIWPIARSLIKMDGAKKPTAIHGPFSLTFHPLEKAKAIATAWKISSHRMTCVTKTMNGGWRLEFKLYSKLWITFPLVSYFWKVPRLIRWKGTP
jgi:hypothetical protein